MKTNKEIQAVKAELFKSSFALQQTAVLQSANIHKAAQVIHQALKSGGKLLICGNGGSAADSQHLATELVVRFQKERRALAALALTTDASLLTAEANDHGFDAIFSRQVEALGNKGDALLAISTSGNSANVLKAVQAARKKGLKTIGLSGGSGGKLKKTCHLCLLAPGDATCRVQECHLAMEHIICGLVEGWLGKK
ncbi:SIS domain-containing protein [candidate division TA06 bacterium]|uniref:Phosphoheptose isomerase n=1 Tax=candidate division TA06 bacterium TaxID=2250710 RepID=A0A933MK09_UNCT6|nr:SIS domain-containing protein [candidate division TA06 bacterium]